MEGTGTAVLTLHCSADNVVSLYSLIKSFMRLRTGEIGLPRVDRETGKGFTTISIQLDGPCGWSHKEQVVARILQTPPAQNEPTKEKWCKTLNELGIITSADLSVVPESGQEWGYYVLTKEYEDCQGNIFYEPGKEG